MLLAGKTLELTALVMAGGIVAGCADRACLEFNGTCPDRFEAGAIFNRGGCGDIASVDSPAEIEDGLCCYEVTERDFGDLCTSPPPPPTPSTGVGPSSGTGGSTSTSTGGFGGMPTGNWDCLGEVFPPEFPPGSATVAVAAEILGSSVGASSASIAVCAHTDPSCLDPFDGATTDEFGLTSLVVPTDTPIFYRLVPPSPGVLNLSAYEHRPPANDSVVITTVEERLLGTVASSAGISVLPERGHVLVNRSFDCLGNESEGVVLDASTLDGSSAVVYSSFGSFDPTLFSTAVGPTLLINLVPGTTVVTGYVLQTGETVGAFTVEVRSGEVSSVVVQPGS